MKEYPYGLVRIEFMGELTAARIIFGERGSGPFWEKCANALVGGRKRALRRVL